MRRITRFALWTLIATLVACGCGGSKGSSPATTSTSKVAHPGGASSTSSTSASASPNTSEVNPSGDIPDNQVYVSVSGAAGPFTVKVPEGWSRTDPSGAISFTDKLNSIRLEVVPTAVAPTTASASATEVPAIKAASRGYQAGAVTTVQRKAGPVVLITYAADSGPDPVTGKVIHLAVERYELWRGGKEAIVTLSGPVGADNVDPWKIVTDSFTWQ